ncbi:uncharacterized protein LOC130635742 [Hydractinia symbiolongicarpus]|uniref:uncharacterized protein LOC130635742 n=1 Tax=Hydractinia symbiolongicarpus TaxID=13093 RepID=UPI00254C5072|nr:uncharacterized protein LOC130635742 [Hydractinia symbiolongicarpus]XP_057301182.1 uncharacterized protein LOC130635742 [Hydractinia symbiolongicarpus]
MTALDGVNFYICLTLLIMLKTAMSGSVEAIIKNIEATVNSTAELSWRVETNKDGERVFGVELSEGGVVLVDGRSATVNDAGKNKFGGRLSASFSNNVYKMSIKKIQYNEAKSFTLIAAFELKSTLVPVNDTATITSVKGGPDQCGISLNSSYTVHEGKQLSLLSEICGNPKPILTWKLQNELGFSYSSDFMLMDTFSMRYRYVYKTRRLVTREDCGTKLAFNATGANGTIQGYAVLDVTFSPRKIRKVIFYKENDCINGTWTSEGTGNCPLTYHIHFNEENNIFNTSYTHYAVCNISNVSSVVIWASYRNKYGQRTKVNISLTTPAPSTKVTDACKRPILLKVKSLDTKKLLVTIIITLVITQIANIGIYAVVKLRGTGCNCRNKQSVKKDDEYKDGQDYEVFPATESHYTGLQLETRKETTYADLTQATVNEYSEIKTENRFKIV